MNEEQIKGSQSSAKAIEKLMQLQIDAYKEIIEKLLK